MLVILLITLASLFIYNLVNSENEASNITANLTARSLIDKVDRNFYERFGDVQAFAYNRLAVATVERDSIEPGLQEFMNTMTSYYVLYDLMIVCNNNGKVLAVNTKDKNGNPINTNSILSINMANTDWHKTCVSSHGPVGGAWYSDFMRNDMAGKVYGTDGQGMAFAAPIKNQDGQTLGVWYNYASWKEVTEGIRSEAEQDLVKDHPGAFAVIAKTTGEVISATDQAMIGKTISLDLANHISSPDSLTNREYGVFRSKGAYTYSGKGWIALVSIPRQQLSWGVFFSRKNLVAICVCLGVVALVLLYVRNFLRRKIISRIESIGDLQKKMSDGEFVQISASEVKEDELGAMMQSLNLLATNIESKATFADEISKGNLNADLGNLNANDALGKSLINMRNQLRVAQESDSQRNWTAEGLARIGEVLRSYNSVEELYTSALQFIVRYVNVNQGGLFLLNDNRDKIKLVSCYAYEKKKFLEKEFDLGSGIIGQCLLEGNTIYLTDLPQNYIHITSGLGGANPKALLIVPLKSNEQIYGALEMASFKPLKTHEISFVEKVAESIASSISLVHGAEKSKALVEQLQQQTEELKAQEEEMRQNMEEMQATQEEMARKSNELAKASAEMEGLISGINSTMATIEFTPDGEVLTANENFLKVVKYNLKDIVGLHHRKFVPKEIQGSSDYTVFWKNLASGRSNKGIFKRVASTGETVWLNAIYNPVLDAKGNVARVVKFATDITAEQEMLAQSKGILEGINSTMATIEFTPQGDVITANDNFLHVMKYELKEIKGAHHRKFVSKQIQTSDDYKTFWASLASGKPTKGVFERITSSGEIVFLNAIYNPILNSDGKVAKVMKFAIVERR